MKRRLHADGNHKDLVEIGDDFPLQARTRRLQADVVRISLHRPTQHSTPRHEEGEVGIGAVVVLLVQHEVVLRYQGRLPRGVCEERGGLSC